MERMGLMVLYDYIVLMAHNESTPQDVSEYARQQLATLPSSNHKYKLPWVLPLAPKVLTATTQTDMRAINALMRIVMIQCGYFQ